MHHWYRNMQSLRSPPLKKVGRRGLPEPTPTANLLGAEYFVSHQQKLQDFEVAIIYGNNNSLGELGQSPSPEANGWVGGGAPNASADFTVFSKI